LALSLHDVARAKQAIAKRRWRRRSYNRAPLDRHDTDLENKPESDSLWQTARATRGEERRGVDSGSADRESRDKDCSRCVIRLADGSNAAFWKANGEALRSSPRNDDRCGVMRRGLLLAFAASGRLILFGDQRLT